MRVLSVVTLFTPDGAYGGPTRVALNQAAALRAAGHDVRLAGGASGYDPLPDRVDDVAVDLFGVRRLLPGTGFAGLTSPGLRRWARRLLPGVDVVHVHLARDLVTLPVALDARRAGVPYVLQTHGMIDPSDHPLARPLDALATRRVLRDAAAVTHLTTDEAERLTAVAGPGLRLVELVNGVPVQPPRPTPGTREVLYLARLAPRKRPALFVSAAQRLAATHPDVRFTLVGPDEGEGDAVRALLARDDADGRITWEGPLPLDRTAARVARAAVSVLPSVDEPFPMSVIEAMSAGVPVVVTDTCGLAGRIRRAGAGEVAGPDEQSLVDAVDRLLGDADAARAAGEAGRRLTREELSIDAVRDRLESVYADAAARGAARART
ncbi:glycosyltransferase [Cellulomonas sp. zg-ZUI199]|uniref:Glycosyltransferase n=1 Tax=Cellulomonas wangleii TaxID=2816956 RepID=A0ABX8D705_9CELL|nr:MULTISPECIES: glycosyltransferase [Cellulomonas]MBO0901690.1 glycosyltransferase [Cellulomonas sp. zg-ZUI22]MBO0925886.1 glycosyltransferase [Cellulomonas wangleii]QVI63199.1 glycosyltransferase [Cellulomonas wangleii]